MNKLSKGQAKALSLAKKHGGLKRYYNSQYWIGADIDINTVPPGTDKFNPYPGVEWTGTHTVNALTAAGILEYVARPVKEE